MTICQCLCLVTPRCIPEIQQISRSSFIRAQSTTSAIRKGIYKYQKGTRGRKRAEAVLASKSRKENETSDFDKKRLTGSSALRVESERQESVGKSKKEARAAGFSRVRRGLQSEKEGAGFRTKERSNSSQKTQGGFSRRDEVASDRGRRERTRIRSEGRQDTYQRNKTTRPRKEEPETTTSVLQRSLKDLEDDLEDLEGNEEEKPRYSESAKSTQWASNRAKSSTEPLRSFFPRSIPFTTAASQFLYGTSSVKAALKANRRKFYKLYVLTNTEKQNPERIRIENIAKSTGAAVKRVDETWIALLDKISNSRPHNGLVLEASNLPAIPVISLSAASKEKETFDAVLGPQTKEDEAINGTDPEIPFKSNGWRYPFVLLLDRILDPGNLGAILRSAYYFGVDAVAITTSGSSPITSVVLKAAAGAAEDIKLLKVNNAVDFLTASKKAGWEVHCADKPGPLTASLSHYSPMPLYRIRRQNVFQRPKARYKMAGLLRDRPCILTVGGEGWGVNEAIKKKAECLVSVPGEREIGNVGVDSLNVSVASALLISDYLRPPHEYSTLIKEKEKDERKKDLGFSTSHTVIT